ncbi:MAG TPA: acetyl-CoA carboxylase biotin carboxyl carrier protein [Candidatus Limnocylindria bacterium]|nr:acetyl-CoA carboxylase biotin carboxyl carrier protein [Candidatus Limnocylindria bacterium]
MNLEHIRELIRAFDESTLSELFYEQDGEKVRLRRQITEARPVAAAPAPAARQGAAPAAPAVPVGPDDAGPDFNRLVEVKSPVVGIYYEAPEPGKKPFVRLGDKVKAGDVLCLVEVMKQVTEVTAPQDGQVADVCVTNGSVVEFGQTLIKLC